MEEQIFGGCARGLKTGGKLTEAEQTIRDISKAGLLEKNVTRTCMRSYDANWKKRESFLRYSVPKLSSSFLFVFLGCFF